MKLSLKNVLTASYPRVPKNLAGYKVILKLSPTKSKNQPAPVGGGERGGGCHLHSIHARCRGESPTARIEKWEAAVYWTLVLYEWQVAREKSECRGAK